MTDPIHALMDEYANRPELVAEFHALTDRIVAEWYGGDVAWRENAIDRVASQRPDLWFAYVVSNERKEIP